MDDVSHVSPREYLAGVRLVGGTVGVRSDAPQLRLARDWRERLRHESRAR
jgi:hypothetical protein